MPGLIPRLASFLTTHPTGATTSAMTSEVRALTTDRDAEYQHQGKGKENIYHAAGTERGKGSTYCVFLLTS
jgi:hypothetical protein